MKRYSKFFGYEKVDNCYLSDFLVMFCAGAFFLLYLFYPELILDLTVQDKRMPTIRAGSSLKTNSLKN
jgi:hypothetical protein